MWICFTRSPEDIVSSIRNSLLSDKENDTVTEEQELPEVSQVAPQSQQMPFSSNKKCESALARAKVILDSNKLSFDPKLHIFNVEGSSGIPRVVKLHPKLSCSCPSTNECYHIMAVKLSIGMSLEENATRKTLTQLRRSIRGSKKSGRKHPRKGDIDCIIINGKYAIIIFKANRFFNMKFDNLVILTQVTFILGCVY